MPFAEGTEEVAAQMSEFGHVAPPCRQSWSARCLALPAGQAEHGGASLDFRSFPLSASSSPLPRLIITMSVMSGLYARLFWMPCSAATACLRRGKQHI